MDAAPDTGLSAVEGGFVHAFAAMGSPCEIRVETDDRDEAVAIGRAAEAEARRVEQAYSRYRPDSILSRINSRAGEAMVLNTETAALVDFASQCHALSDGLFDITSGVLRRVWRFDGSGGVPSDEAIAGVLALVGWDKVAWERPVLRLCPGMELDFGGLGKEYAVDRAVAVAADVSGAPVLVNFGGDLRVSGPRRDGLPWRIAIEGVDGSATHEGMIELLSGAVTTSGDAHRAIIRDGRRLSHILDPRTGRPVADPPRSVTVAAASCIEAGFLSTLAMLHGRDAEAFLKNEGLTAWWLR